MRDALEPTLSVRVLEERRVFHGGPLAPVQPGSLSSPPACDLPDVTCSLPPPGATEVTLDASGNLLVQDLTGADNRLTIRFDAANQQFEIADDSQALVTQIAGAQGSGSHRVVVPWEAVAGGRLQILGGGGNDSLTLDLSHAPAGLEVTFDGGAGTDALSLAGSSWSRVDYSLEGENASLRLEGAGATVGVHLAGVEPVLDLLTASQRTFVINAAAQTVLQDSGGAADGRLLLTTSAGGSVAFAAPTQHLTIDAGAASAGRLEVASFDQAARCSLVLSSHALTIRGDVALQSALTARADQIWLDGGLRAARVDLRAESTLTATEQARIESPSGEVRLDAGSGGTLAFRGQIDVSGRAPGQVGGTVLLLGRRVELLGWATIDATGDRGGGRVLVGGDLQGANPNIPCAWQTLVERGVTIDASALERGAGGQIVAWADDTAIVSGSRNLRARGGALGGDGGIIETSGKRLLYVAGPVDASAPAGRAGTWLLDPHNVTIVSTSASPATLTPTFTATANNTEILAADIVAALEAGTSVVISTGVDPAPDPDGTQDGNITVDAAIEVTALAGNVTLTLNAANHVIVNERIAASDGLVLNVVLHANTLAGGTNDDNDAAQGDVQVGAEIVTNGGTFTASGVGFSNASGPITTDGGAVTLTFTGAVAVAGDVTLGGGDFSSSGTTFNNTGGAIDTGGGNLTLTHNGTITMADDLTLSGGTATLTATGATSDILFQDNATLTAGAATLTAGHLISTTKTTGTDIAITAAGALNLTAPDGLGASTLPLRISATGGTLSATTTATGGDIYLRGLSALSLGVVSTGANAQTIQIQTSGDPSYHLSILAASNTGDDWQLTSSGGIQFVGAGTITGRSLTLTSTGAVTSGTAASDLVATNTLAVTGSSLGAAGNALTIDPGSQPLSLRATSGDLYAEIQGGAFATSDFGLLQADGTNVLVQLRIAAGTLTIDSTAAFTNTSNDRFDLSTGGATSDIDFDGNTTLTAAAVTLNAARDILSGTSGTADIDTSVAGGNISLTAGDNIGTSANPLRVLAGSGSVFLNNAAGTGSIHVVSGGLLNVGGVTTGGTAGQIISLATDGTNNNLVLQASATTNDDWSLFASGDLVVSGATTITANRFTQLRAAGAITSGTAATDFASTSGTETLALRGATVGTQLNPVLVTAASGLLNLWADTGDLWVELAQGNLLLSNVTLTVPTAGATIGLSTTSGSITYNAATFAGLSNRQLYLRAGGTGDINLNNSALSFASVTLIAGGAITGVPAGPSAAITATGNITLQSSGAIGASAATPLIVNAGGTLRATTTGPGGHIFLRSTGALSLGTIAAQDPGAQTIYIEVPAALTITEASDTEDNWQLQATGAIQFATGGSIQANNVSLVSGQNILGNAGAGFDVALDGGGGAITLSAQTDIGTSTDPLAVQPLNGALNVSTTAGNAYLEVTGGDFSTSQLTTLALGAPGSVLGLDVSGGTLFIDTLLDVSAADHRLDLSASDDIAFILLGRLRADNVDLAAGDAVLANAILGNDVEISAATGQLTVTAANGIAGGLVPLEVQLAAGARVVAQATAAAAGIFITAPASTLRGQFTTNGGLIDLSASTLGQASDPVVLASGGGNLRLSATTGNIAARYTSGDLLTSQITLLSAAAAGATIALESTGDLVLDSTAGFAADTQNDRFELASQDDIRFQGATLVAASARLAATDTIQSDGDLTVDVDTSAVGGDIHAQAGGAIGGPTAPLLVRAGAGVLTATTTSATGNIYLASSGVLHLGVIDPQHAGTSQTVSVAATGQLNIVASSLTNDHWSLLSAGNIQLVGFTTVAAASVNAQAVGNILGGQNTADFDTSALNGAVTLSAAAIGADGDPLLLLVGTGTLSLTAASSGIWIDIPSGGLSTGQIGTLRALGSGQTVWLRTLNGSLTIGSHGAGFNTADDILVLVAAGSGSILSLPGGTPLAARELQLVTLNGIGSPGAPVRFAAGDLYALSLQNMHLAGPPAPPAGITSPFLARNVQSLLGTIHLESGLVTLDGFMTTTVVAGGAELAGRGTVFGNLTVAGNGILDPGLSDTGSGQLTVTGNVVFSPGARIYFDINPPYLLPGANYDQLIVQGDLTLGDSVLALRGGQNLQAIIGGITLINVQSGDANLGRFLSGFPSSAFLVSAGAWEARVGTFRGPLLFSGGDGNDVVIQELLLTPPAPQPAFTLPQFRIPLALRLEEPPQVEQPPPPVPQPNEPPLVEEEVELVRVRKIQVRLVTTIDDAGNVEETTVMEVDVQWLQALQKLLYLLPDDRYRVYLILEGGEARRIMDVVVRDGRPFEPEDIRSAIKSRPGTSPAPVPDAPAPAAGSNAPPSLPRAGGAPADAGPPSAPLPGEPRRLPDQDPPASSPPPDGAASAPGAAWPAVQTAAVLAAVVASRQQGRWDEEVDRCAEALGTAPARSWRLWRWSLGRPKAG